jgi:hypothetical protein
MGKNINYPSSDWFDFGEGVEINNSTINYWVQNGYETLKENIRKGFHNPRFSHASGNTIVWGHAYLIEGTNNYNIVIHVYSDYKKLEFVVDKETILNDID